MISGLLPRKKYRQLIIGACSDRCVN